MTLDDDGIVDEKRRWLSRLLDRLPARIRPNTHDQRFQRAAHTAYARGWEPEPLAQAITARGYEGATNPTVLVIMRMEDLAQQPPPPRTPAPLTDATEAHCGRHTCVCNHLGCDRGWLDDNPPSVVRGHPYPSGTPCPTCRPQLAQRLANVPPPGQRSPAHDAFIRHERTLP